MKYLLRNKKVEYLGTKKQLIEYVKEKYKDDFWVRENSAKFDSDFGSFKFALSCLGLWMFKTFGRMHENSSFWKIPRKSWRSSVLR